MTAWCSSLAAAGPQNGNCIASLDSTFIIFNLAKNYSYYTFTWTISLFLLNP